jgi:hypothetical protein
MSADLLREAAGSMRKRAEAVEGWYSPEAWATTAPFNLPIDRADAEHIASWHPAVAIAVADLLDRVADKWVAVSGGSRPVFDDEVAALAVARAYLGRV